MLRYLRGAVIVLLAAVGVVVHILFAGAAGCVLHYSVRSEVIREIVMDCARAVAPRHPLSIEKDITVLQVPCQVSLAQGVATQTSPIKSSRWAGGPGAWLPPLCSFLPSLPIAIVNIGISASGDQAVF